MEEQRKQNVASHSLESEFVSYEQALSLKELGFDKPCFKYIYIGDIGNNVDHYLEVEPSKAKKYNEDDLCISQPLKQQVFRWFREKYEFYYHIFPLQITASDKTGYRYSWEIYNHTPEWIDNDEELLGSLTYEDAENACIDKLIELTKQQSNGN